VKRKTLNPVVSPEIPVGWPRPWQGMQATETGSIETRGWLHPGVADGIEQHRDVEATRQARESSWFGERTSRVWIGVLKWEPERGQLARDEGRDSEEVG
jgi:hypothetical protein